MLTIKEQVQELLEGLPEDISFEQLQYHLFVREKIEKGLQDFEEGKIVTNEEMQHRFAKWLEA